MTDETKGFLWGLLIVGLIHLLFGCSKTVYVPLERTSHDTTYLSKVRTDSVHVRDSVFVWAHSEGDTVYRDKVVTRYEFRYKVRQDTVLAVRSDTISIPIATVRELGWWERTRIRMFVPLVVLCVLLCVSVWWMVRNR